LHWQVKLRLTTNVYQSGRKKNMEQPPALNSNTSTERLTPEFPIKDNNLAIISLVAAILGWTLLPLFGSIVAVITGHLAKKEIRESLNTEGGNAMATAALILGYIQLGIFVLIAIFLILMLVIAGNQQMVYSILI